MSKSGTISEKLISELQKYINKPFTYKDLLTFLDKQKDFLMNKGVSDGVIEPEYNALWDTVIDLEAAFKYAEAPNLIISSEISCEKIFAFNLKQRNKTMCL